jgi:hypothetical protein
VRSSHLLDQPADQFGGRERSRQWRSLACPLRVISGLKTLHRSRERRSYQEKCEFCGAGSHRLALK